MEPLPADPAASVWLVSALRKTSLFAGADMSLVERALARLVPFAVAAGERIIREGAVETAFYILQTGRVSVTRARMVLLSSQVDTLGPGDFFGEMALLVNGAKRTATVTALEPCRVFRLSGDDFRDLLARNPDFNRHITHVAQSRKAFLR